MNPKVLHVSEIDKFIPPFIDFVEANFGLGDHYCWLLGDHVKHPVKQNESIYRVKGSSIGKFNGFLNLVYLLNRSDKVILHNLLNLRVVILLLLMPWLLKKCYWVIWGADLYFHQLDKKDWKWKVKEYVRRPVIRNMGHLVTYIPGDVELARQWYGAKGQYHECLMYLSNVVGPITVQAAQTQPLKHTGLNILVGNSADPTNNHVAALEKLLPYKNDEIKIFVPLSYGDQVHAKLVIEKGLEWFGDKFVPLTSFMVIDEYLDFLKGIDIGIFNHKRQQAMGNTITLLAMGKTVYLRSDVSQWKFFKKLKITCLDVEKFKPLAISSVQSDDNADKTRNYFSAANLLRQYAEIFGS